MPAELDPLSQLIGGLTAQVSGLGSQLIDLRSEIVTNRTVNQGRWDELSGKIDAVQAEYRNVKHEERRVEQERIALNALLKGIQDRLEAVEKVILVWRVRVSTIVAIGVAAGAVIGFLIRVAVDAAARHWMG